MSAPHIIWTLQRTGGTTFATLLSELSDWPRVEHEPFNRGRKFGWIAEEDPGKLDENLTWALWKRPVIKHCHDMHDQRFNAALLDVATRRGYRHIVLGRQDETARILSLELAEVTGAWGPDVARDIYPAILAGERGLPPLKSARALDRRRAARAARNWLEEELQRRAITPHRVSFEELYACDGAGVDHVWAVAAFLDLELPKDFAPRAAKALRSKSQNSARLFELVPNIKEMRDILAKPDSVGLG